MQQLPSHGHQHTAMATGNMGPCHMAEHGLERIDSLNSAYSKDHIATTCYNIQVTSYYALV